MTNDDGVHAAGLRALGERLAQLGDVTVVAPAEEVSGVSHALTTRTPVRYERMGDHIFAVDGTPADCVNLAVLNLLPQPPELLVSGINSGPNVGDDVTYSGTVAGAMEGALLGIPSFAISLTSKQHDDFSVAAEFAAMLASTLQSKKLPHRTYLNVNVPPGNIKGVRITSQGTHQDRRAAMLRENGGPSRLYSWLRPGRSRSEEGGRLSDIVAIRSGLISVSPLHVDFTNYQALDELASWGIRWDEIPRVKRS